ncbi:FtsW/RodA/SpoVE family cell cycle protein [Paenibacillus zeisoli]|uniref:FtsW/RodA/SpoVE family cell cycle protein n=1 Tax=Paenibacillus zeisoli TaxID=2496267 RepID=A0A3S1D6U0_9BACL|nr:FtsW/RodA/SpoVE family cell cycle protein [Paenibacillus zeisoli]RUT27947.1 FtsW/RodA/SpoVE family cell cycle protein [Paenibacillus zeisoli]
MDDQRRFFLDRVCTQVKAKEVHPSVREELDNHLEELIEARLDQGYEADEAVNWAVAQMGDPDVLGKQLHQVHRPRINFGLILIVLFFAAVSIISMWSVVESYTANASKFASAGILEKQVFFLLLGIAVMIGVYFLDYRKLYKAAWYLYGFVMLGFIFTFNSPFMAGQHRYIILGSLAWDWANISTYFLLIAIAGILQQLSKFKKGLMKRKFAELIIVGIPILIFIRLPALAELGFYLIGCTGLYAWMYRRKISVAVGIGIGALISLASGYLYLSNGRFIHMRDTIAGAFNPYIDPNGYGYVYVHTREAVQSAGWWGRGLGAPLKELPFLQSDSIVTYLLYSFGWGAGIILAIAVLMLIHRMIAAYKRVDDKYGKSLILVIIMMLGARLVYGLGMSIGYAPIIGVTFPLVGYGGSHLLIEFAAVGLLLSIYRRKDIIRAASSSVSTS